MEFSIAAILRHFNEAVTFYLIFPGIALLGLYLTIKLRFLQFSKLGLSIKTLMTKSLPGEGQGITHYQAVAAVLAGNIGTGNIAGMAIALTAGGPGALVWMWIIAFLGAAIQYASCVLGAKRSQTNSRGEILGGPMYYLSKPMGKLFACFLVLGALTIGNFTQVNSICLPFEQLGVPPLLTALVTAALVGLVILGGMQRFARASSSIVPIMAILYFGSALVILGIYYDQILPSLILMFKAAFAPSAVVGGTLGYGVVKTITTGFDRGIFATDAGTGIVPILQSAAKSKSPITNGVVTLIAPVLVMIVCTTTGLVLMVTGVWTEGAQSSNMVTAAFQKGLGNQLGLFVVVTAIFLFSYTTILAWACCAERAVGFLFNENAVKRFRYFFIATVPIGALVDVNMVWLLADISISLMLTTNMIGVARHSREVILESRSYFRKPELSDSTV